MIEIKVEIQGLDEIEAALKVIPFETKKELETAIKKSMVKLANQTIKEAPVNKQTGGGNLRQNIVYGFRSFLSGIVESRAPYSEWVHDGTRPHVIRSKGPWSLVNKRTGQGFGRVVNHPGTAPNPFMTRAYEKVKSQIDAYFATAVENLTNIMKK